MWKISFTLNWFRRVHVLFSFSVSPLNLQKWFSEFFLGAWKFFFWSFWGGVLVFCCRCVPIPSSYWNNRHTYADRWVRNFDTAEEIQRIDFLIQRKRLESAKHWLLFNESFRRLQSGEDLLRRQRALEGEDSRDSDLEPLNAFLRLEKGVARGLYESCCVLTAELSILDERKSRLVLMGAPAPNNGTGRTASLHIHRNSQLPAVNLRQSSINLRRLHEDRTAPPSGSGNRLIAPGEEQDFGLPWQDPPGIL